MYIGHQHTVTATQKAILPFECVHCRRRAEALLIGVGQGAGNSPYFLDEDGAKQRAASAAQKVASANAKLTLSLAQCPACHRRNETAVSVLKLKSAAAVAGSLAAFVLMGLLMDKVMRSHHGLWIFAPIGVFVGCFVWWIQRVKWTTVDRRVAFIDEKDLPAVREAFSREIAAASR